MLKWYVPQEMKEMIGPLKFKKKIKKILKICISLQENLIYLYFE